MQAFYSDHFVLPLPAGHRFPMAKYRLLRDRIAAALPAVRLREAPAASDGELLLAHEPDYVRAVAEGRLDASQQREIGFPWSAAMVERARRSVGATVAAARAALREGVAANLAGGTHHAQAGRGSGFCVFNDIAVAARMMQAERHREQRSPLRVVVIDLDVHQGNGTAAIFRDDPTVFTLSIHGANNFPFRKEPSDLDVDLPDGCRDEAYLAVLEDALATMWARHGEQPPGLVFYLAGADPLDADRLGRLSLTAAGLAERDRRVFDACTRRGIPVCVAMGGGYAEPIEATVEAQFATYRVALEAWSAHASRMWHAGPGAERPDVPPASA